jgi:hypothetical protein
MVLDVNVIALNQLIPKKLRLIIFHSNLQNLTIEGKYKLGLLIITLLNEILISHAHKLFQIICLFPPNALMIVFTSLGSNAVNFGVM